MKNLRLLIDDWNGNVYNPVGLNILWPVKVAFLFVSKAYPLLSPQPDLSIQLEIEYY